VRVVHVDEAALGDGGLEPVTVSEPDVANERGASKVKLLLALEQLNRSRVEPRTSLDPECERGQFGRFTRSSFSTSRAPTAVLKRLKTPAA